MFVSEGSMTGSADGAAAEEWRVGAPVFISKLRQITVKTVTMMTTSRELFIKL